MGHGIPIDILNLYDVRHSLIGDENTRGISGGQRKRVNIGIEMVADPAVLFLDEPTSGLDSTGSLEVCTALRNIAESGLTVVTQQSRGNRKFYFKLLQPCQWFS